MALRLDIEITPIDRWAAADQSAWARAIASGGSLFDDDAGALAGRRPQELKVLQSAYGRWLGFLAGVDAALPGESGLTACHDRGLIDAFLQRLKAVAPCTARAYMTSLLTVCRALDPDDRFDLLHKATRHLWQTAKPEGDKLARMVSARDLYRLGFELMKAAPKRSTPLKQASCYRDGLMIAMLVACPVRLGNFIAIEIGRQLVHDGTGYRLCFSASEVKNRRAIELPLPEELTAAIRIWIEVYRPKCLSRSGRWHRDGAGEALWVSESGDRYSRGFQVRERIERATERRFGKCINPHLFRDIAATSIATELPADVKIIRSVLGHSSLSSGERFYNQAQSISASRAYLDTLAELQHADSDADIEEAL